jgi:hypothetical protein
MLSSTAPMRSRAVFASSIFPPVRTDIEALTTPREGGVVGSFKIGTHQYQHRPHESLRLSKRQLEDKRSLSTSSCTSDALSTSCRDHGPSTPQSARVRAPIVKSRGLCTNALDER